MNRFQKLTSAFVLSGVAVGGWMVGSGVVADVQFARAQAQVQTSREELKTASAGEGGAPRLFERFASSPAQDSFKLAVTHRLLEFRRTHADIFQHGDYEALAFEGSRREHAFGFARRHAGREVLVIVPRLIAGLVPNADAPLGEKVWGDTIVRLPERVASSSEVAEAADSDTFIDAGSPPSYRHALTAERTNIQENGLRLADVFGVTPVAFMEHV